MSKVNNKNTKRCQWRSSGVFIVNVKQADKWLSSNAPLSSSENAYQKFISCGGCLAKILQKWMKIRSKTDATFRQVHKFARTFLLWRVSHVRATSLNSFKSISVLDYNYYFKLIYSINLNLFFSFSVECLNFKSLIIFTTAIQ